MARPWKMYVPFVVVGAIAFGGALLTASPTELEAQLQDLGSTLPETRHRAIDRLAKANAETVADLIDELDNDHTRLTKASIAIVACKAGVGQSHAGTLKTCLESADAASRQAAISILATTKQGALAHSLLGQLAQDEAESTALRTGACIALGSAGAQARTALLALTRDQAAPTSVRYAAMTGLAACSMDGATDVLKIVGDPNRDIPDRKAAISALVGSDSLGPQLLKNLAAAPWAWMRKHVLGALASTGRLAFAQIMVTGLADGAADVRMAALRGLITLKGEGAHRGSVRPLMNDADVRVQSLAALSTGRTSKDIAAQVRGQLVGLLASANFNVRYEAALALSAHGDKAGLATMQADQASRNQSQALKATYAVKKITGVIK